MRLPASVGCQNLFRKAKVGELAASRVHKDICWLYVSVEDVARVQKVEGAQKLQKPEVHLLLGEGDASLLLCRDQVGHVAAVTIVHDDAQQP